MFKQTSILFSLFLLVIITSCENYTKSDYLSAYESFVIKVKRNWKSYTESDWNNLSKENYKFYEEDYKKFAAELKPSEMIRIQRFNFVFLFYKGDITVKGLLNGDYNEVFEGIAVETKEIVNELYMVLNDYQNESKFTIINKLLE